MADEEGEPNTQKTCTNKRKKTKGDGNIMKEKRAKTTARKKPGFDTELFNETSYYTQNGLRYVRPYTFTFTTYCKRRWLGRTLLDVFKDEFRSETPEYYEKAIKIGKITVNGMPASSDVILKDNDIICNKVHRHEPPVTDEPLEMVELNEELVILNKPSSIPVHPCGRYRHNTIVFLLGKEHNLTNLYTIHRIDRLTSGILMFARTLCKAQELEAQVRERKMEKTYLCRVTGEFPGETIDCAEPITVVSHKVGICRVSPDGKPCRTVFTKLSFNGKSSLLSCVPHTGRMHQIRVHLQWLGFPITDDPIYNHKAWGPERGKGGVTDELALKVISALAKSPTVINTEDADAEGKGTSRKPGAKLNVTDSVHVSGTEESSSSSTYPHTAKEASNSECVSRASCDSALGSDLTEEGCGDRGDERSAASDGTCYDSQVATTDSTRTKTTSPCCYEDCSECQITRRDPTPAELTMCLHALSYKGPNWEYRTKVPRWAEEDWQE